MKILITGRGSFIGSYLKSRPGFYEVHEVCLIDQKVPDIDFTGFEIVLHVAAIVHQSKKISLQEYFQVNTELAINTAIAAKENGVKHFIFMSTVKVYGVDRTHAEALSLSTPCDPRDSYGLSKLNAEKGLSELEDDNFRVAIIRSPVVYGPGVKANIYRLIRLVDKLPILPLGGIKNKRTMVFAGNLVELIKKLAEQKASGVFLAGDPSAISTSEFILGVKRILGRKLILFKLPSAFTWLIRRVKPGIYDRLMGNLEVSTVESNARIGFHPPYEFDDALKETIDWYLKNNDRP